MNRRHFLTQSSLLGASLTLPACAQKRQLPMENTLPEGNWRMPDEGEAHAATWMAFGASQAIWGRKLLQPVRENLALIANTLIEFEPVKILVREAELKLAQNLLDSRIELIPCPLDDLWIRDTGPTFIVSDQGQKAAIDFNFNGWGGKQEHAQDARISRFIAEKAQVPLVQTPLVMEGGGLEVNGQGLALLTESCTLNQNRNPGMDKAEFEALLKPLLGLEKILWLPGMKGQDITDGHIDFYARFAQPEVILAALDLDEESPDYPVTQQHLELLQNAKNAQGKALQIETLEAPFDIRPRFANEEFAAGYIGYYLCNDALLMQEFGDEQADAAAQETLEELFPEREVIALNLDALAAGGGSIHCATQQEPKS